MTNRIFVNKCHNAQEYSRGLNSKHLKPNGIRLLNNLKFGFHKVWFWNIWNHGYSLVIALDLTPQNLEKQVWFWNV